MNYTERFEDYYEILGVSRNASVEEIKKAKRELSKKYHPDKVQDEELKKKNGDILARINNAADILLDPSKKFAYDMEYDQRKKRERMEEEQARYEQTWYEYDFRSQRTTGQTTEENWYDNGFQRDNTKRTYEHQYQRTTSGPEQKRATAGSKSRTQAKYAKKSSMFDDIKRAAREVKEDEVKAQKGARRAHKNVNDFINRKFGRRDSVPEEILYRLAKGSLHVFVSTLRELSKIGYITKDSLPKFVIRNRRGMAIGLAAFMMVAGLGSLNENDIPVTPTEQTSISADFEQEDPTIPDSEVDVMLQEEEQITTYTIKRNYTVKAGDTLSDLAEQTGISMAQIQYENNITSPNLIRIGDNLTFTYTYSSEDLEYFTNTVRVPSGTTVKDIAKQYNTDIVTIISLNGDSIVYMDEGYYIITDTVKVPNFATQRDIEEAKAANQAYSKHQ